MMKRNTLIGLVLGIGLMGLVLFKNVYKLNQRIEEDREQLETFENDLLRSLMNRRLNETETR